MAGLHIENGTVIELHGRRYTCGGRGPGGRFQLLPHTGRGNKYLTPESLFDMVQRGELSLIDKQEPTSDSIPDQQFVLSALSPKKRETALMRHFYMLAVEQYRKDGGKLTDACLGNMAHDTHAAYLTHCRKGGVKPASKKPMSASSIRRWYCNRWIRSGGKLISLVQDKRGNSHSKLSAEQNELLHETIQNVFLDQRRPTRQHVYRILVAKIHIINRERDLKGLPEITVPSYLTLCKHIQQLDLYEVLKARVNSQYAYRVTRMYGITPPTTRHLEQVQIDHTQLDVYVDCGEKVLIRPWLTMILDCYSKAIIGYCLTIDPPSAESVMVALRMATVPKNPADLGGETTWSWPMYGLPSELVLDNGKEFHGRDLEIAAAELGFTLNFTPPRKPYYKAQIERKFGSVNRALLSRLTGQVFKYEPERHGLDYPHLNLERFHHTFLQWITTVLHQTPNQQGYTPEQLWRDSVQKHGAPGSGLSESFILISLSKSGPSRIIHPNGIQFNNLIYNNEWLSRLRNNLSPKSNGKPQARFKWSAYDVGLIWVLDPFSNCYFPVHSKEPHAHGRSLYNHRVIVREQRHRKQTQMADDKYIDAEIALNQTIDAVVSKKAAQKGKIGLRVRRYLKGQPTADNAFQGSETLKPTTAQCHTSRNENSRNKEAVGKDLTTRDRTLDTDNEPESIGDDLEMP